MTTTVSPERLVPVTDVAKRLGIPSDSIGTFGVPVLRDWSGRPVITETDAAGLRERLASADAANRQRKAEAEAQRAREAQLFEDDRERRYWTAFATVVEHGGAYGDRDAPAVAYSVLAAEDPENELQRVIESYGKPSESAVMYVMGRSRKTSATGREKGRPSWLR